MSRTRGSASKNLGRRAFGTSGEWRTPDEATGRFGEVIDPEEEILRKPVALPVSRPWKPRPGRIYNFPIRSALEEK